MENIIEQVISDIKNSNELDRNIEAFKDATIKSLEFDWGVVFMKNLTGF